MADPYHSPAVPEDGLLQEWIPADLYQEAVDLDEKWCPLDDASNYLTPTACPSHVRNLLPLARAPTINFVADCMMPPVAREHEYRGGHYRIGQVQFQTQKGYWKDFALIVNQGDSFGLESSVRTGHWGGAFVLHNSRNAETTLTPVAWIRSVGNAISQVEQAKNIPESLIASFNNEAMANLDYNASVLGEEAPTLFGASLGPGICTTVLEKLVGVAYAQMMKQEWKTKVEIPLTSGPVLADMVFAIAGSLSMKRADFLQLVEDNGGVVKKTVTKEVTHLISPTEDSDKAIKAKERGAKIVTEEEVLEMIRKSGSRPQKRMEDSETTEEQPVKKRTKVNFDA